MGDRISIGIIVGRKYRGLYFQYKNRDQIRNIASHIIHFGLDEFKKMMERYPSGGSSLMPLDDLKYGTRETSNNLFIGGISYDDRGDSDGQITSINDCTETFAIVGDKIRHYEFGKLVNTHPIDNPYSVKEIVKGIFENG